jgi:hypothetical protein
MFNFKPRKKLHSHDIAMNANNQLCLMPMNSVSSQEDSYNMDGDAEPGMTIMKPTFGHLNTKIQMKRIKRNEFVNKVPS